jgi:hypothetical protein
MIATFRTVIARRYSAASSAPVLGRLPLTGGATGADTGRVWFFIRPWLHRQSPGVQRVFFGVFALIGGVFLWVGVVTGDRRGIVFGVLVAVAWPLDTFVWSRVKLRLDKRLYR